MLNGTVLYRMITMPTDLATKTVTQKVCIPDPLHDLMDHFKAMVNEAIRIGLEHDCHTRIKLTRLAYSKLPDGGYYTTYKTCAISQAVGRLKQMRKSIKRGIKPKSPYVKKPYLTNSYAFKITGCLFTIPYKPREPLSLLLNDHTVSQLENVEARSFTITPDSLSISVRKTVSIMEPNDVIGIDRNLRNITCGNYTNVTFYKTAKLLSISENTSHVVSALKRNDHRIRKKVSSKLGKRRYNRTKGLLHRISKDIVHNAKETKSMIVFEDLKGIRKLYRKGNRQGTKYRRQMNGGWPFYELQRQVQYKAAWEGIPVKFVDPRNTSKLCPICGKRTQEDRQNRRKLWCNNCGKTMDRDVAASMNIARKGWLWYVHPGGDTGEAMVPAPGGFEPAVRKVDVSKLACR